MEEKVIRVFKIVLFKDKVIKIGLIEDKLSYVGFEKDNIHDFYKSYKVRNVIGGKEFEKYINLLKKFELKEPINLDFKDLNLVNLTDKQIDILFELSKLNYGQYMSYSEFAKHINKASFTRFIATCMSKNPILLLIPCHRLISKNNEAKYRSGSELKKFLLQNNY
ncbi:methylated-DNA--[protein]-cysteine S-methyltransferase [Spiroplasma monobiae]|nr:methylated-DNA--[protein]-cysteine S-methyltransferase [Spiroplasma monobiae]